MKRLTAMALACLTSASLTAGVRAAPAVNVAIGGNAALMLSADSGYGLVVAEPGLSHIVRAQPVRIELYQTEADIVTVERAAPRLRQGTSPFGRAPCRRR
ncbi:MAG: hypothetical protein ACRYG4_13405 [Janthinobacterium lividum]